MKLKPLYLPISIFIALGCFIYLVKPAWDDYGETKERHKENVTDLEEMEESRKIVDGALSVYEQENLDNKFLLRNSIPEGISEENFLKELDDMLLDTGTIMKKTELVLVEESKRKIAEGLGGREASVTNVSLTLDGNYFGLKKVLYLIENFNRFVKIDELLIKLDSQSSNLNLFLELSIFHEESGKKMGLSLSDFYFASLLKNGLNLEVLDEYMEYRGKAINFNAIEIGEKGKDNLFDLSRAGAEKIEIIGEVASSNEEGVVAKNQEQSSEESVAGEGSEI
ncbi:MAG: hypothetical protein KAQ63_02195 [Candidatus Moranbacteria bacterium]|nr:hypothetical protein [Candidatus Moranbacteria bacterium]